MKRLAGAAGWKRKEVHNSLPRCDRHTSHPEQPPRKVRQGAYTGVHSEWSACMHRCRNKIRPMRQIGWWDGLVPYCESRPGSQLTVYVRDS